MNDEERGRDHDAAARAAAERAAEAHIRYDEINQRIIDLRAGTADGSAAEVRVQRAGQEAIRAVERLAVSARRAKNAQESLLEAHESAARTHDAAALAHDRADAAGLGDHEAHQRRSRQHRSDAAADRAAGRREQIRLRDEYPRDV